MRKIKDIFAKNIEDNILAAGNENAMKKLNIYHSETVIPNARLEYFSTRKYF